MYKNEEEFLKNYDSNQFEKLSMTTDILIVSVSDEQVSNYRKTNRKHMSILLVKRDNYPFKDKWCLPGGFLDVKENLNACPLRILERETNLKNIYLEQLYTFGEVKRDPRMRVVSTAYMALVDKNKLNDNLNPDSSWFDVSVSEEKGNLEIILDNGNTIIKFSSQRIPKEGSIEKFAFKITENNDLAFDHALVILLGLERLKNKIEYTDIVFHMMPEYFTLGELQQVYEVILNKKLLDPAFRRIIASKVEKTSKVKTGGGHRPSALFKYKKAIRK